MYVILVGIVLDTGLDCFRWIVKMSATETGNTGIAFQSMPLKPPSHPTYDLKGVIKLALAEDAGDRGLFHLFQNFLFSNLNSFILTSVV